MRAFAIAALSVLAALPLGAEEPVESAAARQITNARLELVREKLPQVLALPLRIAGQPKIADCPETYDSYRQRLSAFASAVVSPMHHGSDPADAEKDFDAAYHCAVQMAYGADVDKAGFESRMRAKLALVDSQLAQLSAADKRRLVAELSQPVISERQAQGVLDKARGMVARLESQDPDAHRLDDWLEEAKPARTATAFADSWSQLHASEFRPATQVQFSRLDTRTTVPAAAPAALPQNISGSIAGYLQKWSGPLSPVILAATCMVESDCRQTVHGQTVRSTYVNSKTGQVGHAYGAFQIIPQTAKDLAAQLGVSEQEILHDANTNVRAGAAYLETKLENFHADLANLNTDLVTFARRIKESFSPEQLDAAERGLRGRRRPSASSMSVADEVVQTAFASGLGPLVMAWAGYNGQVNPDKVQFLRYNSQSRHYVLLALLKAAGMTPASTPAMEAGVMPQAEVRVIGRQPGF